MALSAIHLAMLAMFAVWVWLVVRIVTRTVSQGSIGLPAAFILTMTFLYGGCFVYAVPGYTHLRPGGSLYLLAFAFTENMVVQATFVSLLGVFGFAIGCGVFSRVQVITAQHWVGMASSYEQTILKILGSIAVGSYFLHYLSISFPMSSALVECGRNLAVPWVCLGAMLAKRRGLPITKWLMIGSLVPAYYFFVWGFVSYGFLFGIVLLAFWMSHLQNSTKKRSKLVRVGIILIIVQSLLTVFVAWLSFRDELREIVWHSDGGSMLEVITRAFLETEIFSIWNFESLDLVNIRLNLNFFIGRMMEEHRINPDLRLYGSTLIILPLTLVPRFIWPGKPSRGGSDFMSEHTGIALSDSATFGTGTVFEFYINFGAVGVFFGFIVLGVILTKIDRKAVVHLHSGNYLSFARLFVVGIVAIDPLLRPFFIVNGAAFAWIIMTALKALVESKLTPERRRKYRRRPKRPPQGIGASKDNEQLVKTNERQPDLTL